MTQLIQNRWAIRNVKAKTRARARMLAIIRGVSLSQLLENLVDEAWLKDKTKPTPKLWRKFDRVIGKYQHVSREIIK